LGSVGLFVGWGFFGGICNFLLWPFRIKPHLYFRWKERSTLGNVSSSMKFYSSCPNPTDGTTQAVTYYSADKKISQYGLFACQVTVKEEATRLFDTILLW